MNVPVCVTDARDLCERGAEIQRAWCEALLEDESPPEDSTSFQRWFAGFQVQRRAMVLAGWRETASEQVQSRARIIALGSLARGEDLPQSDLDFALVTDGHLSLAEAAPDVERFVRWMGPLGFAPCMGNVMGANPRWFGEESAWRARIASYAAFPDWANVRYLYMTVDALPLEGAPHWTPIAAQVRETLAGSPFMKWQMAHLGIRGTVGFGSLRGIRWDASPGGPALHIKDSFLAPMIHALRLLSLHHGVDVLGSVDRALSLGRAGALGDLPADGIVQALWFGWRLRARRHAQCWLRGERESVDLVFRSELASAWQEALREHLRTAQALERLVCQRFPKPRGSR
ncbi:DUF294 nucleotidyltransferase-like domain-containing protein [Alicyclobacillus fructus]|uniref:DUF294 nucleotidyltransferase-like domain-containing protein n=1 Tax=Alicyclobacillus fructus TaxID=2816082 RepID=UPI001A8FB344|nr:DUF294 nucleotidyltransferase-like domain-containing protein [Alicyclobacillus fructus]